MKLATGEQMRALDKLVIENYGVPGIVLMENAAIQVALEIYRRYAPLKGKSISVVCGKGNNGGDGIAVARQLAANYQAIVTVWLVEPMDKASEDTSTNLHIAKKYGITIDTIVDSSLLLDQLKSSHLIVDAVLGTGANGPARPVYAAAINAINSAKRSVVSIDIPSGISETGVVTDPTVQATCTVTLVVPKLGLYLYPGITYAGDIVVVDISYPPEVTSSIPSSTIAITKSEIASWLPKRLADRDSNKGKFGSIALLAGSQGFVGAASLASEGAARTGAGLVTLGVPDAIFGVMMSRVIDSVMTKSFTSSNTGSFSEDAIDSVLASVHNRDSVGFGPGIGVDDDVSRFACRFIAECNKPLVIDADALTILSKEPDHGASIVRSRKFPTVMTPHPGEMGRLLGTDTQSVQKDRLSAVREASQLFGAVVILKGQATLVASPDGRLAVNTTGNPGMATGGSGDVLTGVTTTLLAQIDDPWEAASAAVFIHGLAGDIAADEIGMAGLLASDIPIRIPAAIRACYE